MNKFDDILSNQPTRGVELDVKGLTVTNHQAPWYHQRNHKVKYDNYFSARKRKDIHHQQGAELWCWKHLGFGASASTGEEGSSGATPEDSPEDTRGELGEQHQVHQSTPGDWKR